MHKYTSIAWLYKRKKIISDFKTIMPQNSTEASIIQQIKTNLVRLDLGRNYFELEIGLSCSCFNTLTPYVEFGITSPRPNPFVSLLNRISPYRPED